MAESDLRVDQRVRRSVRGLLREALLTGLAVVVPLLITLIVLAIAFQYVYRYIGLFATVVLRVSQRVYIPGIGRLHQQTLVEAVTPVVLLLGIFVVGMVVNYSRWGQRAVDYFDYAITKIPGIGSVYDSFRQMSDVVIESDTQNFRDVKLVEFPHEGTYTLGFVTNETPRRLRDPVAHEEMLTLFLPLAPNPVMGGHLVHVPLDRVHDVDLTVEEGLRAVVTSGVAVGTGRPTPDSPGLSPDELRDLGGVEHASQQFKPELPSHNVRRRNHVDPDRAERYDRSVSPRSATTPTDIARRARPPVPGEAPASPVEYAHGVDGRGSQLTPAEWAGRYASETGRTESPPADLAGHDSRFREPTVDTPAETAGNIPRPPDGNPCGDGSTGRPVGGSSFHDPPEDLDGAASRASGDGGETGPGFDGTEADNAGMADHSADGAGTTPDDGAAPDGGSDGGSTGGRVEEDRG